MMLPQLPLAAVEQVIGVIVFLITVVGWIMNFVSNQQQVKPPAVQRPRPPRPAQPGGQPAARDRLQEEIERFRRENAARAAQEGRLAPETGMSGDRQRSAGKQASGQRPGGNTPKKQRSPQSPRPQPEKPLSEKPQPRKSVGSDIANRSMGSHDLGSGIRKSVQQHIGSQQLAREVAEDLKPRVSESVKEHLGTFSGSTSVAAQVTKTVSNDISRQLVSMLRSPANVKQAILVSTILQKPLGLRRREH